MGASVRLPADLEHARDGGHEQDDHDDGQRDRSGDLGHAVVHGAPAVQDQLGGDEGADDRQPGGQVDEPVQQTLTRKYSARSPRRAKALAAKTR